MATRAKSPKPIKRKPRKRGPTSRLTFALVETALRRADGLQAAAAKALKCAQSTLSEHIGRDPRLQAVVAECRELFLDEAESALLNAVRCGEAWAVCFALKTRGRSRGYVERQAVEHTGLDGGPIAIEVVEGARAKLAHLIAVKYNPEPADPAAPQGETDAP